MPRLTEAQYAALLRRQGRPAKPRTTLPAASEHDEQCAVIAWARIMAGLGGPDEDITMLTLAPYTDTHVALLGTYPYRDRLKALALYPDLRYDGDERCWLLTIATLPMLYGALGDVIAPMPPGFWLALPLPSPAPVRKARRRRARTPRERAIEQRQAHEAGRVVVALKEARQ